MKRMTFPESPIGGRVHLSAFSNYRVCVWRVHSPSLFEDAEEYLAGWYEAGDNLYLFEDLDAESFTGSLHFSTCLGVCITVMAMV